MCLLLIVIHCSSIRAAVSVLRTLLSCSDVLLCRNFSLYSLLWTNKDDDDGGGVVLVVAQSLFSPNFVGVG